MKEKNKRIIQKLLAGVPDKAYLSMLYRFRMNKKMNWKNPLTFNEKLQYLKVYDRKPIYSKMVDKYDAKEYVANIVGDEYIIPTLGVWDNFDDIDFNTLPNQFVLKCTHDSGGLVICKDKNSFDKQEAKKKIQSSLKSKYYLYYREWAYKSIKPRIIAEQYMEDKETGDLRDYKFFAFNGVPKALFIATDRNAVGKDTCFDFFDMDFKHLDIRNGHPNADIVPAKPKNFELMKSLASVLSKDIPQLRVDFYEVNGKVYFGELTFAHWGGMMPFEPEKWDRTFGDWIDLPSKI